jgi:hypothetical protein
VILNREEFFNRIDKNQPELNGFLHDQTKTGGMKYLKAIELYENKKLRVLTSVTVAQLLVKVKTQKYSTSFKPF